MKLQFLFIVHFFISITTFSQVERSDIIDHKIKSVTRTTYYNSDEAKKQEIKTIYSKTGDDSLEYYNGELTFRFTAKKDANGRVVELIRHANEGEDEWRRYKYNKNGSYSIEIIAQGAGTISLAKYDKKNLCMEEEVESSYTLVYMRNANGQTEKILSKDKDNKTEIIAEFYFDKDKLRIKGEGTTEGGKTIYFKYNEKKLISETKTVGKENGKQTTETILLAYEFYED